MTDASAETRRRVARDMEQAWLVYALLTRQVASTRSLLRWLVSRLPATDEHVDVSRHHDMEMRQ